MLARKPLFLLATMLLLAVPPIAGQAAETPHWVHYKWLSGKPALPRKVVVLPVAVEVVEVSAGGVEEEVPDWSKEASQSVFRALSAAIRKQPGLTEIAAPRFSGASADNLDEHMALYKLVVNTASKIGWEHKIRRFDYGIGPGLRAIAAQTGADAAIMVYGRDHTSTAGRKARAVAGHIPILNMFTGPAPQLGHSFIHIGMVDLRTGDLLWMNSEYREGSTNLRDPGDAAKMVNEIFEWYPGIEKYRAAYVR
ncbi:hypothetical protein SVA_2582 [Sulfurifustis variabilis]|uniref:Lipoprotein n=1 Tax=Sulfurifustis variabilis TaxID=1675686 RepID=A0A1B4V6J9_9GAMM|nr:hypothetical protein [Sulfurifustis variabilis]BAU49130.1 hypothetical protein SVA_2582 [Sulfurifustis variabilis]